MELIGKLKDQVEKAKTKEEAKKAIEEAGMRLTEEELDMVSGGRSPAKKYRGAYNTARQSGEK